jgi:hypothetical protein
LQERAYRIARETKGTVHTELERSANRRNSLVASDLERERRIRAGPPERGHQVSAVQVADTANDIERKGNQRRATEASDVGRAERLQQAQDFELASLKERVRTQSSHKRRSTRVLSMNE